MIPLIIIAGPTAIGKSDVAFELAKRLNTEIISADSMQVYRYFNIGTAKPSPERQKEIQHHLIDIVNPDEGFSAGDFNERAFKIAEELNKKGEIPIVSGGTGLYIKGKENFLMRHIKQVSMDGLQKDLQRVLSDF